MEMQGWNFVALEYCWIILNRVMMVFVTPEHIGGVRVGGPIASAPVVHKVQYEPMFYVNQRQLAAYQNVSFTSDEFLKKSRANFRISRNTIVNIDYFPKKWGMGSVPYTGRLVLHLVDGKQKELIILGDRDAKEIQNSLMGSR